MGSSVFTGPLLAGNVLNSDGSGNLAGVGGYSGIQNVGFCVMAQVASITQSSTAAATSIVIPAQSQIIDIRVAVTTGWSGGTLSIGTSTTSNELASAIAAASLVQGMYTVPVTSLIANWNNSSNTQDVNIYVKSSAGTAGVGKLIVRYLQGINGFTNGQYT
jgi:hypothetical protein